MRRLMEKKEDCCGCQACSQVCPKHCIEMRPDEEGFSYPWVDDTACIRCGACERVCPIVNVQPDSGQQVPDAYAAVNLDDSVRQNSSSGGVFSALAEHTIRGGGVVFGAALSGDCRSVFHTAVDQVEELDKLRGSKYLQSSIGDTYIKAKKALTDGKPVLFTGTPCQIEGLKTFLGREYDNLLCADLICHGVPSPGVWNKHLDELEKQKHFAVSDVLFRHKKWGWHDFSSCYVSTTGKKIVIPHFRDTFMQAFLTDGCLRPSCHDCRFRKFHRVSDLTMADFWGIEDICPEMDDDMGTSLILVHSPKGQEAMDALAPRLKMKRVDAGQAIKCNPAMVSSCAAHKNRQVFLDSLKSTRLKKAVQTYLPLKHKTDPVDVLVKVLKQTGLLKIVKKILGR